MCASLCHAPEAYRGAIQNGGSHAYEAVVFHSGCMDDRSMTCEYAR